MERSERSDLYEEVLRLSSLEFQLRLLQEECGELNTRIGHYLRNRCSFEFVAAELADVKILTEQMEDFFGKDIVDLKMEEKLERLKKRVLIGDVKSGRKIENED